MSDGSQPSGRENRKISGCPLGEPHRSGNSVDNFKGRGPIQTIN